MKLLFICSFAIFSSVCLTGVSQTLAGGAIEDEGNRYPLIIAVIMLMAAIGTKVKVADCKEGAWYQLGTGYGRATAGPVRNDYRFFCLDGDTDMQSKVTVSLHKEVEVAVPKH